MAHVAARYVGDYAVILISGSYVDALGVPLTSNLLSPGDTVCLPDYEVLGYTNKYVSEREGTPQHLGLGRVILGGDEELTDADLYAAGYEFVLGRSDFEPV